MTKKEAIEIILSDKDKYKTSLNYAINYCLASIGMSEKSYAFEMQCAYILNNIIGWRHPQAKEVRETLRRKER
jgi:hypothetical protein